MSSDLLSIVVPVFNEEAAIDAMIDRLVATKRVLMEQRQVRDVEILIVDDGSTDRTAERIKAHAGVQLVQHGENRGYGAALKTGFQRAQGQYVAFLDADASYRPESIPDLLERLRQERADLVIGSRMMTRDNGMPAVRRLGNWLFAKMLGWLVGRRVTDSASGLRMFRREIVSRLLPLPDSLSLTPAMSARAFHEGLKTIEVPIPYDVRAGRSKLRIVRDGLRFFSSILTVSRLYNPLKLFGVLGMVSLLAAVALGTEPVIHYLQVRRVEEHAIYRLFTIMVLLVTGMNFLTFGAFCNQVLATLYPQRPAQQSVWARLLLRRGVVASAGRIGAVFVLVAVLVNSRTILEYVTTGHIHVHWSYVLTGATLSLTGVQLIMCRFLLTVLNELQEAQRVVVAFNGGCREHG